jgi:hypothetical protein
MTPDEIVAALNAYRAELEGVLGRFTRDRNGLHIDRQDNYRLRAIAMELVDLLHDHVPGSAQHTRAIANSYNEGVSNFYNTSSYASVEQLRAVVGTVATRIERNRDLFAETAGPINAAESSKKLIDALEQTILRFHAVAVQMRDRYSARPTLDLEDEYDVQDLLHALLRIHFDDVRPEEYVPSYAGSASRTDFLLPQINTIIEVKKTRSGLNAKAVGEQLIVDIARYKKHPQCNRLYCFVYDPEGRIANPVGIENDLSNGDHGIDVRVLILPKVM